MWIRALVLLTPTALGAAAGYVYAHDAMMGTIVGGSAGLILGIALNAFPNLNQDDDDDKTDLPQIDP